MFARKSYRISRTIVTAFLLCILSIIVYALLSLQVYVQISNGLERSELAYDMVNDLLEVRRFEKNFFLFGKRSDLSEAISYIEKVRGLYISHRKELPSWLDVGGDAESFRKALDRYQVALKHLDATVSQEGKHLPKSLTVKDEQTLRKEGHRLIEMADKLVKEERRAIDKLVDRAVWLCLGSLAFFIVLALGLSLYVSRLMLRPFAHMHLAMEQIAGGDFTPLDEEKCRSEEFRSLYRTFNNMVSKLNEQQEQLAQSRKIAAIGTFTAGIAHELNNPINNIVLTAEGLKEDFPDLDKTEILDMVDDIIIQSERAAEIVRNLLQFSRSEQHESHRIEVPRLVRETLRLVRNQMRLAGVKEEMEADQNLPVIWGDENRLKQVFLNLFLNAVEAMPDGGVLWVRVYTSDDGKWVKVGVSDTGVGIDPEDLPRVLDPFFTTKEAGKGTGLGLSVSYGIVKKHGGSIEVQSVKGKGSTFTVILPAHGS